VHAPARRIDIPRLKSLSIAQAQSQTIESAKERSRVDASSNKWTKHHRCLGLQQVDLIRSTMQITPFSDAIE
jgi:hypothetical protein